MPTQPVTHENQGCTETTPTVIAVVKGEPLTRVPEDLYIPPDALEIILETFSGPLDLLLYLIKKQNLDILNIPILHITQQYMIYIELMQDLRWELAAEYLLMAAMLAEIKSRLLLPRTNIATEVEDDPRAELVRRLLEYERYKLAAESLDQLPRQERDVFAITLQNSHIEKAVVLAEVSLSEFMQALHAILIRAENYAHHRIQREPLSIRERMSNILERLEVNNYVQFSHLFILQEGRIGVVVTFIAILELLRQAMIELVQTGPYAPIHIRAIAP